MSWRALSRRRLLAATGSLVTLAGCLSDDSGSGSQTPTSQTSASSPTSSTDATTTTETQTPDRSVYIDSLTVADFFHYPLGGAHSHVHRRSGTQYVIVRLETSYSGDAVRTRSTVELDGESVPLADRQPVPFANDTVDVAFAVSKSEDFESGRLLFEDDELRSISASIIGRLNEPPMFEVSEPSVSPDEVPAGERTEATVRFDLTNRGEGRGTFGASVTGNYLSGSSTMTATLDPGARREVTGSVPVVGRDDAATVRLDWGADQWEGTVPVVGTSTTSGQSDTSAETP